MIVEDAMIGVWRDVGIGTRVNSRIDSDTIWTVEAGPYLVDGDVAVDAAATLRIEPGTTVFFGPGSRLVFNGQLTAVGPITGAGPGAVVVPYLGPGRRSAARVATVSNQ